MAATPPVIGYYAPLAMAAAPPDHEYYAPPLTGECTPRMRVEIMRVFYTRVNHPGHHDDHVSWQWRIAAWTREQFSGLDDATMQRRVQALRDVYAAVVLDGTEPGQVYRRWPTYSPWPLSYAYTPRRPGHVRSLYIWFWLFCHGPRKNENAKQHRSRAVAAYMRVAMSRPRRQKLTLARSIVIIGELLGLWDSVEED